MTQSILFFFVPSYSQPAYIDYGGTQFYPVPVCPKVGLDGTTQELQEMVLLNGPARVKSYV